MALGSDPQLPLLAPQRTYGQLQLVDSQRKWELSEVPPHVAIRLKHLFPRIPKTDPGPWRFPADQQHAADLAWFLQRYPMRMTPTQHRTLLAGRDDFERANNELEQILLVPDYTPPAYVGIKDGEALRGYQARAIEVLRRRGCLLLGDVVGLGKTHTAIGACLLPEALPAIITVEPHVQKQWKQRIESFSNLRVHLITTTKPYSLPEADIYLFRYSNLAAWTDVLAHLPRIGLAGWDEIQQLRRGIESQKGTVSKLVAGRARYRLGLSATPIYGYGTEIWHVMRFIDDGVLGDFSDFTREWTNDIGRIRDPQALGSYLREQHVYLRRQRKDVGRELPPVNTIVEPIGYDQRVVQGAEELAQQLAIKASEGSFIERGHAARDLDLLMRHRTGIAKAAMVANYVRILLDSGEPVVLVGWHRDVYDIWMEQLADFNPALYTGSETTAQKAESERRFLSGETNLLIMSLRTGAGLDSLQNRASIMVFGELDWSPGIHHQLIGRLDRDRDDGIKNYVTAIYLVTDEGSDPPMMDVLGIKASEAHGINDPGLAAPPVRSDTRNLQKLVQRYLKRAAKRAQRDRTEAKAA